MQEIAASRTDDHHVVATQLCRLRQEAGDHSVDQPQLLRVTPCQVKHNGPAMLCHLAEAGVSGSHEIGVDQWPRSVPSSGGSRPAVVRPWRGPELSADEDVRDPLRTGAPTVHHGQPGIQRGQVDGQGCRTGDVGSRSGFAAEEQGLVGVRLGDGFEWITVIPGELKSPAQPGRVRGSPVVEKPSFGACSA